MRFIETELPGAYVVEPERLEDERGFFARTWCARQFEEAGLVTTYVQSSIAYNRRKNTLRGMHFQAPPHEEVKMVRCTMGRIYDVIVDLRPDSPTFGWWTSAILSAENRRVLYVPKGFGHGYQTLEEDTEVYYEISEYYTPGAGRGIRWDDPTVDIRWPEAEARIVSKKDRDLPYLDAVRAVDLPAG